MDSEKIRELVLKSSKPFVIQNGLSRWSPLHWPLSKWLDMSTTKGEEDVNDGLTFRVCFKACSEVPQWESTCIKIKVPTSEFIEHSLKPEANHWMYFDYKDCATWLKNVPNDMEVPWSLFGFPEQDLNKTTIWIGSTGANTPCHADSYGCNLVAQVIGKKQWILYPPSDEGINASQTRVPYEESSIYSKVNFQCGKRILDSPELSSSEPYVVTLEPGDVLFVPFKWWHYVQHLSSAVSINTWIQLDDIANFHSYVDEFLVQHVFRKFTAHKMPILRECYKKLLNPNEWPMLENDDSDEPYYDVLKNILTRNSKYLVPSSQTITKPKSSCNEESLDQNNRNQCFNSHEKSKENDPRWDHKDANDFLRTEFVEENIQTSKEKTDETSLETDSPRVLDIQRLTPMSREEFVELCKHKCSCFEKVSLKRSESFNSAVHSENKESTIGNLNDPNTAGRENEDPTSGEGNNVENRKNKASANSPKFCLTDETLGTSQISFNASSCKKNIVCPSRTDTENLEHVAEINDEASQGENITDPTNSRRKIERTLHCGKSRKRFSESENPLPNKVPKSENCKISFDNAPNSSDHYDTDISDVFDDFLSPGNEDLNVYPDYLIRAFTHTEVIKLVREKLLEEIRNGKSVYNQHLRDAE